MSLTMSRAELLASSRFYDKHRDGPDALTVGTPTTTRNYAGGTRIALDDSLSPDKAMFFVRTHASEFQSWLVTGMEDMRLARIPDGQWDWDCHFCHTSVMTEIGDTTCPNCLLA